MKLKEYLKTHNLSQATFSRSIGESAQNVSRYVNGDRKPEDDVMQKIIDETAGEVTANDFYDIVLPRKKVMKAEIGRQHADSR
jgi:transcriptional regulator with XRE-family HTH domain